MDFIVLVFEMSAYKRRFYGNKMSCIKKKQYSSCHNISLFISLLLYGNTAVVYYFTHSTLMQRSNAVKVDRDA